MAAGLRSRNPDVKIGLADPDGAALYNYYAHGELKAEGSSITEGIGQGRITANLEGLTVDLPYNIPDTEALDVIFDLLAEEGLCLGSSSGVNVAGAIRMARDLAHQPGNALPTDNLHAVIVMQRGNRPRRFGAGYTAEDRWRRLDTRRHHDDGACCSRRRLVHSLGSAAPVQP